MMRILQSRNRLTTGLFALMCILFPVSCKWNRSVTEYVYGKTPIVEIGTDVLYVDTEGNRLLRWNGQEMILLGGDQNTQNNPSDQSTPNTPNTPNIPNTPIISAGSLNRSSLPR